MTFQKFLNQYDGQNNVGDTAENKGQCVGLVEVWVDNIGGPHIWGNAQDLYINASLDFFVQIPNTPSAIPQQGDIIVWSGAFNGGVGHTGIATGKGDTNTFECFEQNDPIGSNCHLKTYNYSYVVGWLRAKNPVVDSLSVPKTTFEDLVRKGTAYDGYCEAEKLDKISADSVKMVAVVDDLQRQLSDSKKSQAIVEAERDAARKERDQAIQNASRSVPVDSGGNTGLGSKDGTNPVSDIQLDSSGSGTTISNPPSSKTFWASLIEYIRNLWRG